MQGKNKKNTDISERILQMLDYLNISANSFAKEIGYSRSQMLYDIVNGKSRPSFDFFYRFINSEYSDIININWLIAEKGEMLLKPEQNINAKHMHTSFDCKICSDKDKLIETLEQLNNAQSKTIKLLEDKIAKQS